MATYLRPGVYGEENLNPPQPQLGSTTAAAGAFVGASDKGPTTATYISSWGQYITQYGGFNTSTGASQALPLAVYQFFVNGGREAYILRVTGAGIVTATRTVNDRAGTPLPTLTIAAKNGGAWGNNIYFDIQNGSSASTFDLVIKYGGTTSAYIVERYSDLTMASGNRYFVNVVNSQSNYVKLTDLASASVGNTALPAVLSAQPLATGANGAVPTSTAIATATTTGFEQITRPLVLNAPGVTAASDVSTIVNWAEGKGSVFVVIDCIDGNQAAQTTASASYPSSSYGAVYFPYISIYDPVYPSPGTVRRVPPGGSVVGQYLATDSSRGVFKAPAGIGNRVAGAVDVDTVTSTEQDTLYSGQPAINVIKFIPGNGICVYGARTLKGGTVDKFVNVRRTLIHLRKAIYDLLQFTVFEANDSVTWRKVNNIVSSYLTQFWQEGGLRGPNTASAFFVKCDSETNTLNSIEAGELRVQVGVALQRPAEFVVFTLSQFDGGSYVVEA